MSRSTIPALDRIIAKIEFTDDCWLRTGAIGATGGYAVARADDGRVRGVHRLLYELIVEAIPAGLDLDHLRRVRHCVNPDHLEPVTRRVNVSRGIYAAGQLRKATCKHGHPFDATYAKADGRAARICRTCANDANRRYRARQKEAA